MDCRIEVANIGKKFRYEWIFKNVNRVFEGGQSYAILGPNGSGKSTFMKVLSGHLTPSSGQITFYKSDKKTDSDEVYQLISYAAPYIEMVEEMTLTEIIEFHTHFKPLRNGLTTGDLINILSFQKSADKEVRFFSSGMKQRLKLVLSICTDTPILLLDEPTTNLDAQGVEWYRNLMQQFKHEKRLVVIASNIEHDYDFCDFTMNILDFK